jgi:septal ring factor EnvC (AmiA/AmiB activator)
MRIIFFLLTILFACKLTAQVLPKPTNDSIDVAVELLNLENSRMQVKERLSKMEGLQKNKTILLERINEKLRGADSYVKELQQEIEVLRKTRRKTKEQEVRLSELNKELDQKWDQLTEVKKGLKEIEESMEEMKGQIRRGNDLMGRLLERIDELKKQLR